MRVDTKRMPRLPNTEREKPAASASSALAPRLNWFAFMSRTRGGPPSSAGTPKHIGGARIAVIDSLRLDVIDVIDVGSGPFDLAFVTPAADARCATTDEGRPRREAWVTEFMDDSVAIIDIDPESPTYHQVIAHVR